jgi:hypothetical protein
MIDFHMQELHAVSIIPSSRLAGKEKLARKYATLPVRVKIGKSDSSRKGM